MSADDLIEGLRAMGYDPIVERGFVRILHDVPAGSHVDERLEMTFKNEGTLSAAPPHWIHVKAAIADGGQVKQSEVGPGWSKLSRPHPTWAETERNARALMAHVNNVFRSL